MWRPLPVVQPCDRSGPRTPRRTRHRPPPGAARCSDTSLYPHATSGRTAVVHAVHFRFDRHAEGRPGRGPYAVQPLAVATRRGRAGGPGTDPAILHAVVRRLVPGDFQHPVRWRLLPPDQPRLAPGCTGIAGLPAGRRHRAPVPALRGPAAPGRNRREPGALSEPPARSGHGGGTAAVHRGAATMVRRHAPGEPVQSLRTDRDPCGERPAPGGSATGVATARAHWSGGEQCLPAAGG